MKKKKDRKMSSKENSVKNKFKVRKLKISGKSEEGLIASVWLNCSRRGKLLSLQGFTDERKLIALISLTN